MKTLSILGRGLAIGGAVLTLASCMLLASPEEAGSISADDLAGRIAAGNAPYVLDVRSVAEFEAGHIPGARNIPHDMLAERVDEIAVASDAEVVVHCKSGRRAGIAEQVLLDAGFTNVEDLEGHMDGWSAAGHPTE